MEYSTAILHQPAKRKIAYLQSAIWKIRDAEAMLKDIEEQDLMPKCAELIQNMENEINKLWDDAEKER